MIISKFTIMTNHLNLTINWASYFISRPKGKIIFDNLSELHFREIVSFTIADLPDKIAYSYHYQDKEKVLIFRYDNAEHHTEIPSFPHHKHIPQSNIEASQEISLAEVLFEICHGFER